MHEHKCSEFFTTYQFRAANGSSDFSRSLIRKRMLPDTYRRVSDIFTGVIDYRVYGESFASPAHGSIRLFKFDNRVTEARITRELTPRSVTDIIPIFLHKTQLLRLKGMTAVINYGLDEKLDLEITIWKTQMKN